MSDNRRVTWFEDGKPVLSRADLGEPRGTCGGCAHYRGTTIGACDYTDRPLAEDESGCQQWTAPCGCVESYPQLVAGRVSHGPGCRHEILSPGDLGILIEEYVHARKWTPQNFEEVAFAQQRISDALRALDARATSASSRASAAEARCARVEALIEKWQERERRVRREMFFGATGGGSSNAGEAGALWDCWRDLRASLSPGTRAEDRPLARCPETRSGRLPPDELSACEFCPGTAPCLDYRVSPGDLSPLPLQPCPVCRKDYSPDLGCFQTEECEKATAAPAPASDAGDPKTDGGRRDGR